MSGQVVEESKKRKAPSSEAEHEEPHVTSSISPQLSPTEREMSKELDRVRTDAWREMEELVTSCSCHIVLLNKDDFPEVGSILPDGIYSPDDSVLLHKDLSTAKLALVVKCESEKVAQKLLSNQGQPKSMFVRYDFLPDQTKRTVSRTLERTHVDLHPHNSSKTEFVVESSSLFHAMLHSMAESVRDAGACGTITIRPGLTVHSRLGYWGMTIPTKNDVRGVTCSVSTFFCTSDDGDSSMSMAKTHSVEWLGK